ncbi:hypothetical protein RFI_37900, partial [Reticulomyxa filosa]
NGHTSTVYAVEYSPFVINDIGNSNVICSGSDDNTIRFWDIRSNKNELYMIKDEKGDIGILCFKFVTLKKKKETKNVPFVFGDNWLFCLKSLIKRSKLILNLFDLIEHILKDLFYLTLLFKKIEKTVIYDFDEMIFENVKLFNNVILNLNIFESDNKVDKFLFLHCVNTLFTANTYSKLSLI